MKYLFGVFLIASLFMVQKPNPVKQFEWLVGKWKLGDKEVFEKWQIVSDTMITGIGFHIELHEEEKGEWDEEVRFDETMRLVSRGKDFFYIPLTPQNKGKEVEFEITSFTKRSFIAENPRHDFPQRIVYELIDEKHLHAYIEGKENGKYKKIDFRFTKEE